MTTTIIRTRATAGGCAPRVPSRKARNRSDEVEVAGELFEELGDSDGYRGREVTRAFAAGATALLG